ncbi:MAG TPA: protein kinase [Candidatus Binataceae bacterium]|nr:protein kinase [Candidatus Binataceae bacterium]
MIPNGTIVGGRYRVTGPLGGGGMKLVYLAEDLRLAARPCALAEMVDSFTSPEQQKQAVNAFMREADMLAQLSNEHIPRVFDRFSDENRHYLVMEFIEGVTLEQKLKEAGGRLGESDVIDIAIQVLDTLDYLHHLEPPVIYRDLKPSNVMITPRGLAKLIDFGIARHFQPMRNATMIGTQGYAPPEQYRGQVEFRSDLYSLGATMHHALSGRDPALEPPFSFPPLRSLCPGITPALADLVDQALKYDAPLRVADATEFKDRLVAIREGKPAGSSRGISSASAGAIQGRSQMNLPLSNPAVMTSSAPTMLSDAIDSQCPRCGRRIPTDSNYCSFCAANVTGRLGQSASAAPDSRTIVLSEPYESASIPPRGPDIHLRHAHRRRNMGMGVLAIAGAVLAGFMATRILVSSERPPPSPFPPMPGVSDAPDIPDSPETMYSDPRLEMLRMALDASGYNSVQFAISGNTIVLKGLIASESDRMRVRMLVRQLLMFTGITAMDDRGLKVAPAYAAP